MRQQTCAHPLQGGAVSEQFAIDSFPARLRYIGPLFGDTMRCLTEVMRKSKRISMSKNGITLQILQKNAEFLS
jgi:hypothetical protein